MHNQNEVIPLPMLAPTLRATFGSAPSYKTLYQAIVDGRLPAHFDGRRWQVNRADLGKAAELFSLTAAA